MQLILSDFHQKSAQNASVDFDLKSKLEGEGFIFRLSGFFPWSPAHQWLSNETNLEEFEQKLAELGLKN